MRECIAYHEEHPNGSQIASARWEGGVLDDAYKRAGLVTAEYAKTFYLGTKLMTPEKARAVWAIYVWCRRTDELVDGPNASHITPEVSLNPSSLYSTTLPVLYYFISRVWPFLVESSRGTGY